MVHKFKTDVGDNVCNIHTYTVYTKKALSIITMYIVHCTMNIVHISIYTTINRT